MVQAAFLKLGSLEGFPHRMKIISISLSQDCPLPSYDPMKQILEDLEVTGIGLLRSLSFLFGSIFQRIDPKWIHHWSNKVERGNLHRIKNQRMVDFLLNDGFPITINDPRLYRYTHSRILTWQYP